MGEERRASGGLYHRKMSHHTVRQPDHHSPNSWPTHLQETETEPGVRDRLRTVTHFILLRDFYSVSHTQDISLTGSEGFLVSRKIFMWEEERGSQLFSSDDMAEVSVLDNFNILVTIF